MSSVPSDYMVQKMIENDLLADRWITTTFRILTNIDPDYLESVQSSLIPETRYCVPYCWGTVGILYNKTMVDDPVDSWDILWDEKYKDEYSDAGQRPRRICCCLETTRILPEFHRSATN